MFDSVSRRAFLRLVATSLPAATVLAGCGSSRKSPTIANSDTVVPLDPTILHPPGRYVTLRMHWPSGQYAHARSIVATTNHSYFRTKSVIKNRAGVTDDVDLILSIHPETPESEGQLCTLILCSEPDGQGEILARASVSLSTSDTGKLITEVVFGERASSISVNVVEGSENGTNHRPSALLQLAVNARDAKGRLIFPEPEQWAWSSSKPAMATVDDSGLVYRRENGTVIVTVRDKRSGKSASVEVNITDAPAKNEIDVSSQAIAWLPGTRQLWTTAAVPGGDNNHLIPVSVDSGAIGHSLMLPGPIAAFTASGDGSGLFIIHTSSNRAVMSHYDVRAQILRPLGELPSDINRILQFRAAPGSSNRTAMWAQNNTGYSTNVLVFEGGNLLGRVGNLQNSALSFAWGDSDQHLYIAQKDLPVSQYQVGSNGLTVIRQITGFQVGLPSLHYVNGLLVDYDGRVVDQTNGQVIHQIPEVAPFFVEDADAKRIFYTFNDAGSPNSGIASFDLVTGKTTAKLPMQPQKPGVSASITDIALLGNGRMAVLSGNLRLLDNVPF